MGYYGKWKTKGKINRGGQGFIFKVKRKGEITNYALKSYRKTGNSAQQQKRIKRFQSEVDALKATKDCVNVIRLIDEGIKETPGYSDYYFVMELADNTLEQYIIKSKFEFGKIIKYYRQILNAFECIHKKGIIHRDIKPQNILIKDENIMISDFGISFSTSESRITPTLEVVGPRFFLCPESEDGRLKNPDIKCDIYSLGKLLHYLLSNGKKFSREKFDKEEYDIVKIHKDTRFEVFHPLFKKTIVFDKSKRYNSIDQLSRDFEGCIVNFNNFIDYQKLSLNTLIVLLEHYQGIQDNLDAEEVVIQKIGEFLPKLIHIGFQYDINPDILFNTEYKILASSFPNVRRFYIESNQYGKRYHSKRYNTPGNRRTFTLFISYLKDLVAKI